MSFLTGYTYLQYLKVKKNKKAIVNSFPVLYVCGIPVI